jgi:DNA polymerase I-like protein with 3'-5' exonuclease and polymerase domains
VVSMQVHGIPVDSVMWAEMVERFDPAVQQLRQQISEMMHDAHETVQQRKIEDNARARLEVREKIARMEAGFEEDWEINRPAVSRFRYVQAKLRDWKEANKIKLPGIKKAAEINPGSRDQVLDFILLTYGITLDKLDKNARKSILDSAYYPQPFRDFMALYDELQEYRSLQSKFGLEFLSDHVRKDRVHPRYNLVGPVTGRFSSDSPNIQQMPAPKKYKVDLRRCFRAREGYRILSADFSQAEMRIAAALSGDEALCAALGEGKDLYSEIGILLFGLPADSPRDEEGKLQLVLDSGLDVRKASKVLVLALDYGMGAASLSRKLGVTESEARKLIADFKRRFPKLTAYLEGAARFTMSTKRSFTRVGRWRDLDLDFQRTITAYLAEKRKNKNKKKAVVTDDDEEEQDYEYNLADYDSAESAARGMLERTGKNTPMQAGCADVVKLSMALLHDRLRLAGLENDAWIVASVHDEILVHSSDSCAGQVCGIIESAMWDAFHTLYPEAPLPRMEVLLGQHWQKS